MRDIVRILVIVLLLLVSGRPAGAQANDWLEPFPPFRIAGNLCYLGSPNVNPGYKLVKNAAYPAIADDFTRTFETLAALPADLFLGAHGAYFGMEEKVRASAEGRAGGLRRS